MGDVVMTEPALRALKSGAPDRRITLLTSASGAEAAALIEAVDDEVVYAAPWMKSIRAISKSRTDRKLARKLRRSHFDAAVIFTCFSQSALPAALLCYWADIPLRLAHCRENPYHLLTRWARDPEPEQRIRHEVQRQLDLVQSVSASTADDHIKLKVPPAAVQWARDELSLIGVDVARCWIVVHPGATAASRRWPPTNFAKAADQLVRRFGAQIVFTGSKSELLLVESIRSQMEQTSFSLAGRLSVPQLAALLASAPLLISNNTGPVHLAAGVQTPVVDLYALTNPQHTPWRVPARVLSSDVPCKYCYRSTCPEQHHHCLSRISPEEVVRAAMELLDRVRKREEPARSAG